MKIFTTSACFVSAEDLLKAPLKSNLKMPMCFSENEYVKFVDPYDIQYFREREDIYDYSYLSGLTKEKLEKELVSLGVKLNQVSLEWLNTHKQYQLKMEGTKAKNERVKRLRNAYEELKNYRDNKEEIDNFVRMLIIDNSINTLEKAREHKRVK